MRKIETLMNNAIQNEKDWKLANTQVINNNGVSEVFLHNNLIARVGMQVGVGEGRPDSKQSAGLGFGLFDVV